MRYLVKARVKPGRGSALLKAMETGDLGRGSVAGDEYAHDLQQARIDDSGIAQWVETCFCTTPLDEERPHWEKFFDLLSIQDAHARRNCKHENGTEPWGCCDCDCTLNLEEKLKTSGHSFLQNLKQASD